MFDRIKNNIILIILIIGILFLGVTYLQMRKENKLLQDQLINTQKDIIKNDSLRKISDGNYSKLVDFFKTSDELAADLKKSNLELYKRIKEGNEKIIALNDYFITFKGQLDSGLANIKDSNTYQMDLYYPEQSNWFINWNGLLNKNTGQYNGIWNFGNLKFGVTLTQQPNGLFKSNISGPSFLVLDSITVESLPPTIPVRERNMEFLLGAGYRYGIDSKSKHVVLSTGIQWKNSSILLFDVGTDNSITGKFAYKFRTFKRN